MIPFQIRSLRKQHEYSQAQLAKESKLTQGVISRAEDPDYGNLTLNTLTRIAAGFDCAFVGRFVAFSELGKWYTRLDHEDSLKVPSFRDDSGFVERKGPQSEVAITPSQRWAVNAPASVVSLSTARNRRKEAERKKEPDVVLDGEAVFNTVPAIDMGHVEWSKVTSVVGILHKESQINTGDYRFDQENLYGRG
jgi:transcriptional regulator with XRE-family HTH domain